MAALLLIPATERTYPVLHRFLASLPLRSFFATAVQFASPTVTVGIIAIVWLLDRPKRNLLPYYFIALLLAGTTNGVIKEVCGRARPEHSVGLKNSEVEQIAEEQNLTREQTEELIHDRWLGLSTHRPYFKDTYASFPSGHSCAVFAAAAFLTVLYPPGRWVWFFAAAGCALARVRFMRHFPEDVIVGGAIGWVVSMWVFSWCWPLQLAGGWGKQFKSYKADRSRQRVWPGAAHVDSSDR